MDITVTREQSYASTTIGRLTMGSFSCYTLEDQVREREGASVLSWKVNGETAIPRGRYSLIVTQSLRFQRPMPLLLNVPGFSGVRIHSGNTAADTEGCLIVGKTRLSSKLYDSRAAFNEFFPKLQEILKAEPVWISIQ